MKTIYKYKLPVHSPLILENAQIVRVLKVGTQYNKPVMWCEVDTERKPKNVDIIVYMTGEQHVPQYGEMEYVGTFELNGGSYIGHVYAAI